MLLLLTLKRFCTLFAVEFELVNGSRLFFQKFINAEEYFYNRCYFFVFLFFSVIEMIGENLSEMISYELLVASCKL